MVYDPTSFTIYKFYWVDKTSHDQGKNNNSNKNNLKKKLSFMQKEKNVIIHTLD